MTPEHSALSNGPMNPATPPTAGRALSGTQIVLATFTLLLIALVWTANLAYLRHARQSEIESVKTSNANLARAFEEHTVRTIQQIDQILLLVKREFERPGHDADISKFSQEAQINPELALILAVTNEHGDIVAADTKFARANLSDRENFQAHLARDSGQLIIDRPRIGRVAKKWVIPISRRINKPDGSFAGIVVVGIDPYYFSNFYKRIDLGRHGVVTLFGLDGYIRSRLSGLAADVGQDVRKAPIFQALAKNPSGSIIFSSVIDGVTRIYSDRSLEKYPLAVAVGVAESEALANIRERERGIYGAAVAATVFILLFGLWLLVLYRREKQAETAIRRLNEGLVKRAAEIEAANRELATVGYSIAHDLRSPLRAISGFGSILQADYANRLDAEGRTLLGRIIAAAKRMSDLIDGLLMLTRLSGASLEREAVDLSALAKSLALELQQSDTERPVQWRIAEGAFVQCDPELLRIVLSNLLHNAWKFTGKQEGACIEFGVTPAADGKPVYFVRDNGAGFEMEFSDKLFGTFQRLHDVREFSGNGIGLAIVQRIVHRHGGEIWAESTPGEGATFYFTLPTSP
jgi:signal transduction histidine kinase